MRYRYEWVSPLGTLRMFAEVDALAGLYFEGHSPAPKDPSGLDDSRAFVTVTQQLEEYFAGERFEFDLPVAFSGTEFQNEVWSALRKIPFGETLGYGTLAEKCSRPQAVRAIGAAVGRNPISIIIPCHRVIGANGSLTGFAGGIERKRWLLDREKSAAESSVL